MMMMMMMILCIEQLKAINIMFEYEVEDAEALYNVRTAIMHRC